MPISDQSSITGTFGPNLWLVEELYQLVLDDPSPETRIVDDLAEPALREVVHG